MKYLDNSVITMIFTRISSQGIRKIYTECCHLKKDARRYMLKKNVGVPKPACTPGIASYGVIAGKCSNRLYSEKRRKCSLRGEQLSRWSICSNSDELCTKKNDFRISKPDDLNSANYLPRKQSNICSTSSKTQADSLKVRKSPSTKLLPLKVKKQYYPLLDKQKENAKKPLQPVYVTKRASKPHIAFQPKQKTKKEPDANNSRKSNTKKLKNYTELESSDSKSPQRSNESTIKTRLGDSGCKRAQNLGLSLLCEELKRKPDLTGLTFTKQRRLTKMQQINKELYFQAIDKRFDFLHLIDFDASNATSKKEAKSFDVANRKNLNAQGYGESPTNTDLLYQQVKDPTGKYQVSLDCAQPELNAYTDLSFDDIVHSTKKKPKRITIFDVMLKKKRDNSNMLAIRQSHSALF